MKNYFLFFGFFIAAIHFCEVSAQSDALLSSFGDNGIVTFKKGSSSTLKTMAVLPDGEILLYASWSDSTFLIRLDPNGQLDTLFGNKGVLYEKIDKMSGPENMLLLPENKYLALRGYNLGTFIPQAGFGITKHHLNGDLDSTFGLYGKAQILLGNYALPVKIVRQNDEKIVALGTPGNLITVLTRFYPNGRIDSTFDGNGIALAPLNFPFALSTLPDGKILSAGGRGGGYPDLKIALSRHHNTGSLDSSFAINGSINTFFNRETELVVSMVVRPNGKIVLGGWLDPLKNEFAICQFNPDGTLDQSFGNNGLTTTSFVYDADIEQLALLPDGKIIAFGLSLLEPAGRYSSTIARYNENGILDNPGIQNFTVAASSSINLIADYGDGSFLVGGHYYPEWPGAPHFYIAKTIPLTSSHEDIIRQAHDVLHVYPNPASNQVIFDLPPLKMDNTSELRIYDAKGQLHFNFNNFADKSEFIWHTQSTPPGLYFYQLASSNFTFMGKIILE